MRLPPTEDYLNVSLRDGKLEMKLIIFSHPAILMKDYSEIITIVFSPSPNTQFGTQ